MTPEERQLLSGLFDRIRGAANQSRDREAESFIGEAVRAQPYAPYLLSQTVIVQDQALRAANDKLQELERKVQELQSAQQPQHGGGAAEGGFLGSLGRSIFGQGQQDQPPRAAVPSAGYGGPQGGFGGGQPQGGPWGQGAGQGFQGGQSQGGGFLKGALGAAAGVAGGVLLANSISGLFRGNSLGIGSGFPGAGGMGGGFGGGETIVNNYYENDGVGGPGDGYDNGGYDNGGFDNAADFGPDDGGGSDDSYNA